MADVHISFIYYKSPIVTTRTGVSRLEGSSVEVVLAYNKSAITSIRYIARVLLHRLLSL